MVVRDELNKLGLHYTSLELGEAAKEQMTLAELAKKYEVSPVVISRWKSEFLANMGLVFEKPGHGEEPDVDTQELYAQIGQQKVEIEFLKKSFKRLGG